MIEEEQEAIKETIKHLNRWLHIEDNGSPIQYVGLAMEGLKIELKNAIDFIEKQREEIEELEFLLKNRDNEISNNLEIQEVCCRAETKLERDIYWNDKITDKIDELMKDMVENGKTIDVLYDLLEEE